MDGDGFLLTVIVLSCVLGGFALGIAVSEESHKTGVQNYLTQVECVQTTGKECELSSVKAWTEK